MDEWWKPVSTHSLNSQQIVTIEALLVLLSTIFDVNFNFNYVLIPISLIEKDGENLLTSLGIILAGIYFQDESNNYGQDDMGFTNTSMPGGLRFLNKKHT